jgi:hypothetical protein
MWQETDCERFQYYCSILCTLCAVREKPDELRRELSSSY